MKVKIANTQSFNGAKSRFGNDIKVYDDGYGDLYIHRDSMGITGIVRARTWEDAYSICEDEFFSECDETIEQLQHEYGYREKHVKIVLDPVSGERQARMSDYKPTLTLPFVRWHTIKTMDVDAWSENACFQETYGFRPNGPNSSDKLNHGIYSKDINGDSLDLLTTDLLAELEIMLDIGPCSNCEGETRVVEVTPCIFCCVSSKYSYSLNSQIGLGELFDSTGKVSLGNNRLDLIIMLYDIKTDNSLHTIKQDASRLQRLANRLQRYQIQACNGPELTAKDRTNELKTQSKVTAILAPYGLEAEFGDDPRGHSVFIRKPGLRPQDRLTNDLGQRGLGI